MHLRWFLIFIVSIDGVLSLKILSVISTPTKSHHLWVSTLCLALAKRGHEVTFVTPHQLEEKAPNLNVSILESTSPETNRVGAEMFQSMRDRDSVLGQLHYYYRYNLAKCQSHYERAPLNTMVQPDSGVKFDLFLFDYGLEDCLFGLIHRFNYTPTIILSPFTYNAHWVMRVMGTPLFTASPHWLNLYPMPMTIWQRLSTLFFMLYDDYLYYNYFIPENDRINWKYLGEDTPSVRTLLDHVSLALINQHSTEFRAPIGANIIPVGGMHLQPASKLPQDLQDFLDGSQDGAVLMSFGGRERSDRLGAMGVDAILEVFSRLPQRVIWKFESPEDVGNVPPNVMLRRWIPQNDVLGHPKLRAFISHCGGLSTQEAVYHGVPILAIPRLVDQVTNSAALAAKGAGRIIPPNEINPDSFYHNIRELTTDPKYAMAAKRLKAILRADVSAPMERAIFWVEFVAAHRGAPNMRSPLQDQGILPHALLLDVILATVAFFIVAAALLGLLVWALRTLWGKIRRGRCKESKKKVL